MERERTISIPDMLWNEANMACPEYLGLEQWLCLLIDQGLRALDDERTARKFYEATKSSTGIRKALEEASGLG